MTTDSLNYGNCTVVMGLQWGDEGKGKLIDILAPQYDIVVRANGGANAGHTIKFEHNGEQKKVVAHLMPSGMLHEGTTCLIGNGCVVDLSALNDELEEFKGHGFDVSKRLIISDRTHIVFGFHKEIDRQQEALKGKDKIGTTLRGIGPTYASKVNRNNIRMGDLKDWDDFVAKYEKLIDHLSHIWDLKGYDSATELEQFKTLRERYLPMIQNTENYLYHAGKDGKKILIEGANGMLLDIDHGTYPFVTSSSTILAGLCTGSGIAPQRITDTVGVLKAYTTRVGSGPFPTEQENEIGEQLQNIGGEFGATTGRGRRCGWFDGVAAKYALRINGISSINLTKTDVLNDFEEIKICTHYEVNGEKIDYFPSSIKDLENAQPVYETMPGWQTSLDGITSFEALPENCKKYVKKLEEFLGVPIDSVSTGPDRSEIVLK